MSFGARLPAELDMWGALILEAEVFFFEQIENSFPGSLIETRVLRVRRRERWHLEVGTGVAAGGWILESLRPRTVTTIYLIKREQECTFLPNQILPSI